MRTENSLAGRLFRTADDPILTVARLILGVVFFAHGAQKLLGWYGGPGFNGTIESFQTNMSIPAPLAFLVIVAEFFGALGLIFGFLTRIGALGILVVMTVASTVHMRFGLFANWTGTQGGEGFEFHLLAIALSLVLIVKGAGAWSLDRVLSSGTTWTANRTTSDRVRLLHDSDLPSRPHAAARKAWYLIFC